MYVVLVHWAESSFVRMKVFLIQQFCVRDTQNVCTCDVVWRSVALLCFCIRP